MHDHLGRCESVSCDRNLNHHPFGITAFALRDVDLRDAEVPEFFEAAKTQGIIFMTKDSDFADWVDRLGSPPKIIWLTCGNTSNARLQESLSVTLPKALELL